MSRYANSIAYTSRKANTDLSGQVRFAKAGEAVSATSNELAMTPKLVGELIRIDTVEITSAELLALATTPKTIVAAPGAGLFVEFISAQLILNYATTQYTEAADNFAVRYTNGSGAIVSEAVETTGWIDQAADTLTNAIPKKDNIVAATGIVNQALVLDNTNANIAAGDSTVSVRIAYRIVASGL